MEWKRPSLCSDAACVEVKIKTNQVRLRSSDFPQAELGFSHQEWAAFIKAAKAGEYDLHDV